jgi:hypothetical protein
MNSRVRFPTFRGFRNLQPWLPWTACSTALVFGTAVYSQTTPPVPETPPTANPTAPAEVQPGQSCKRECRAPHAERTGVFAPDCAPTPSA